MALRFMQIFVPQYDEQSIDDLFDGLKILGIWHDANVHNKLVLHLLVPAEETEPIMDKFEKKFGDMDGFYVVLFPVEAVLPRHNPTSEDQEEHVSQEQDPEPESQNNNLKRIRVSREELYSEVTESFRLNSIFVILSAIAAILAAVGLCANDIAVIIGAMVIAPLLGPNVGMSFAVTLGDLDLLRRAFIANLVGVSVVITVSVLYGLFFTIDPTVPAIESRTSIGYGHVIMALCAGVAGTLSYTSGLTGPVIGVMVAVALVPPLVTFGMLAGAGEVALATVALLLTVVNVICVNLAGTATFALQGVRPLHWYEADKAKIATFRALTLWIMLLLGLILIIYFYN